MGATEILADMPVRSMGDSKTLHAPDHNRYRDAFNQAVYSTEYETLQVAVDAAQSKKRPLIVAPITHNITAPLTNLSGLRVFADGATITPSADMASILDMRDCIYNTWRGGLLNIPQGRTVDNAIYIYKDVLRASQVILQDVTVQGYYTVGLRIGKQGDSGQCDHISCNNVILSGVNKVGSIGVYCGAGVYGNCLNHTFNNLTSASHETNVRIDGTNAYINGGFFDHALETDLFVDAVGFSIRNVRSEDSNRFLVTSGPSAYAAFMTIEDVLWHGESLATDGEWIRYKHAGMLRLNNILAVSAAYPPVIKAGGSAPLRVSINGLSTIATSAAAFSLGVGATVKGDYIQHAADTSVLSITTL